MASVRLHGAVFACCGGTPPVMLGYRPKCFDFMRSMGLEWLYLDLCNIGVESLPGRMAELLTSISNRPSLRHEIHAKALGWKGVQQAFVDRMVGARADWPRR